jgi:hypothetical protein
MEMSFTVIITVVAVIIMPYCSAFHPDSGSDSVPKAQHVAASCKIHLELN